MNNSREAIVVCRLGSREGLNRYRRVLKRCVLTGFGSLKGIWCVSGAVQARVRQAVKSGTKLIVVIGGDGTLCAAVAELVHAKTTLGVIRSGRANSFALSLGIPNDVEKAIEIVAAGHVAQVDVGCLSPS